MIIETIGILIQGYGTEEIFNRRDWGVTHVVIGGAIVDYTWIISIFTGRTNEVIFSPLSYIAQLSLFNILLNVFIAILYYLFFAYIGYKMSKYLHETH